MKRYTDAERIRILAALEANEGNVKKTARELGMPAATVQTWKRNAGAAIAALKPVIVPQNERVDFVPLFTRAVQMYAQGVIDEFPDIHGKDRAIVLGILVDKHIDYRDGRRGAVTVNTGDHQSLILPPGTTLDDLRELRDGLDANA